MADSQSLIYADTPDSVDGLTEKEGTQEKDAKNMGRTSHM